MGKVTITGLLLVAAAIVILASGGVSYDQFVNDQRSLVIRDGSVARNLSTDTWGIFDVNSGKVTDGNNIGTVKPIASITKLFTAYAALESSKIDTAFVINWNDLYTVGRAGKLSHGSYTTPRELLFPLLIESSNDAGEAIRRAIGMEFEENISDIKGKLKLTDTIIVDGSGLSSRNVSTVRELSLFYSFLRHERRYLTDITSLNMYITGTNGWVNNNPGREFGTFAGGKHGFTDTAGRTFVGSFVVNEREIGIVLLNSSELRADLESILLYEEALEE